MNQLLSGAVAAIFLSVGVSAAIAGIPEPCCDVTPWDQLNGIFLAPTDGAIPPAAVGHIIVRNSDCIPIANASVVVNLGSNNVLCGSAVLTGTTNASGEVDIIARGGGCAHSIALAGVIKANGVTIRAYSNVKSPDFNGGGGDLRVDLSDLTVFANEFLGNTPARCHDYDNNAATGLSDLILFSAAYTAAMRCP